MNDTNEKKYREKYLKYKNKYIDLKAITKKGGEGSLSSNIYWIKDETFDAINLENKNNLFNNSPEYNPQNFKYFNWLDKLLNYDIDKKKIDLNFINKFNTNIFIDTNDDFKIIIDAGNARFAKFANWKYRIVDTKITKNVIILFLEHNEQRKVLKICINTHPVKCDEIYEHIDLEVTRIKEPHQDVVVEEMGVGFTVSLVDHLVGTPNYNEINRDYYNKLNFNKQTKHIHDQLGGDILLSCRNNNAINDYIINLILQQIQKSNDKLKMVKYDNIFITNINYNGKQNKYYCILMDETEGSFEKYLEEHPENGKEIAYDVLQNMEQLLAIVKTPEYLFTHTDMKIENVFYNINPQDQSIEYLLADFDKSSIYYHGIRFYNDFRKNPNTATASSILDPGSAGRNIFIDGILSNEKKFNDFYFANVDNVGYYQLARFARKHDSSFGSARLGIEFEQMYMRYGITQFYTSFDCVSLIFSLMDYEYKSGIKLLASDKDRDRDRDRDIYINKTTNLYKFFLKYMNAPTIVLAGDVYKQSGSSKGDFGMLIGKIFLNETASQMVFKNIINTYDYVHIDNLYITPVHKRVAITPFFYYSITNKPIESLLQAFTNNCIFTIDKKQTTELYQSLNALNYGLFINSNIIIKYTGDYCTRGNTIMGTTLTNPIIIMTNRYNAITNLRSKIVKEYDEPFRDTDKMTETNNEIMATILGVFTNEKKNKNQFTKKNIKSIDTILCDVKKDVKKVEKNGAEFIEKIEKFKKIKDEDDETETETKKYITENTNDIDDQYKLINQIFDDLEVKIANINKYFQQYEQHYDQQYDRQFEHPFKNYINVLNHKQNMIKEQVDIEYKYFNKNKNDDFVIID